MKILASYFGILFTFCCASLYLLSSGEQNIPQSSAIAQETNKIDFHEPSWREAAIREVEDSTWLREPIGLVVEFQLPFSPKTGDIAKIILVDSSDWEIIGLSRFLQDGEQPQTISKQKDEWIVRLEEPKGDKLIVTLRKLRDWSPWHLRLFLRNNG